MLARWKRKQKEYKENAFSGLGKVRRGRDHKRPYNLLSETKAA